MLYEILSDILSVDNVLFVVRNEVSICEIRSNSLKIKQKENWLTIGDNDGPAHMHINSDLVKSAEFIKEKKPERTSYSVRFYDKTGNRILAAFFTKMYDEDKNLDLERAKIYEKLNEKFGSEIKF